MVKVEPGEQWYQVIKYWLNITYAATGGLRLGHPECSISCLQCELIASDNTVWQCKKVKTRLGFLWHDNDFEQANT